MYGLIDDIQQLQGELKNYEDNIEAMMEAMPKEAIIICREGAGLENKLHSFILSYNKLLTLYNKLKNRQDNPAGRTWEL